MLQFSRSYRIIILRMGKKTKKQSTYVTAQTFKIKKDKTPKANLNQYIKLLKTKYSHISTKQYLSYVHQYIKKLTQKKGAIPFQLVVQTQSKIRICQKCDKWAMGSRKIIQCFVCEDSYHIQCVTNYRKNWNCSLCSSLQNSTDDKQVGPQSQIEVSCSKCHKNKNQSTVKCLKCSNFFHKECFGKQSIVCGDCDSKIEAKLKKEKQLTLQKSFENSLIYSSKKKQKNKSLQKREMHPSKQKVNFPSQKEMIEKEQRKVQNNSLKSFKKQISESTNSSTIISNSKNFRSGFPKMTQEEISAYKQKLLYAIETKNMSHSEQLVCHKCSLFDNNQDSLDFALSQLSISDYRMYKQYKRQPIGPFLLQYKEICGYDVVADKNLPKGMIVCEYVGDVYTFRETIKITHTQKNDSLMQLTFGKNADESLFIVPRKFTNIARFLNGINEKDPKKGQKENVGTLRSLAQGKPVILLYTLRDIKKGQSLLYNYGAGGANSYDTEGYM